MAKFINFEACEFANRNGWRLFDISVNVDTFSIEYSRQYKRNLEGA